MTWLYRDFSCMAAQHLDSLTCKVLQSCWVFCLLSIALVSFASWLCLVFSQARDSLYYSQHCSVLFRLLQQHWVALFRDLLHYLFASLSVACLSVYLFIYFASVQLHFKNVRSTPTIVCWQQTEMSFPFLLNSRQERMAFLGSHIRVTARLPSPSPSKQTFYN